MKKLSMIIPTMWRSRELYEMLPLYAKHPLVGEVIIIDNNPGQIHDFVGCLDWKKKIKQHTKGHNIYVNPAWNWGVELSTCEHIALVNDDLLINQETLMIMLQHGLFALNRFGLVGMAEGNFSKPKAGANATGFESLSPVPSLTPINKKGYGFGTFMFMRKECYVPIPNDLKIWRGDHIQLVHNNAAELGGIFIETEMSATIKTDSRFSRIGRQDVRTYNEKYKGKDLRDLSDQRTVKSEQ